MTTQTTESKEPHKTIDEIARMLSRSEKRALQEILKELDGKDGQIVIAKLTERLDVTRSVFVMMLKKLASVKVIEATNHGVKGTYIKILNPDLRGF